MIDLKSTFKDRAEGTGLIIKSEGTGLVISAEGTGLIITKSAQYSRGSNSKNFQQARPLQPSS